MGPKRRSKNEIKQNENKINQTKNNNDNNSTSRRKNSPQKTTQKKQTKSKGFFCCCGSAEDIYHREIQRPDETPLPPQPPAPSKDQSIRNNKINTNTGSTISVASTNNSGPPSLHSQLPTNYLSRNQQELNNNNNNNNGNGNNNNNNSNNNNSNSHNTTNNNNNNNTNNTNSTVIPIPLETSRRQPTSSSSIAASTSTNNRPHPNTRLNSKEIGGDVTELDTSVSTAEKKLPQTRSFLENSTNNINTSTSGLKSTQSRHDMSKQLNNNNNNNNNTSNNVSNNNGNNNNNNINNINNNNSNNNNNNNNGNSNNNNNNNNSNTNTGRDQSTLHGVYGTVANPVAVTASSNSNGFNEMNRMYDVIGIKFERPQTTMGEQIAAIGDAHLIKLEEGCKILLEKIREEKAQRYRYFSELSSTDDSTISNTTPPPVSGDYTEVALIFTEVLQLQNRSKDAVTVLSKAIEMLNSDLIFAKNHRQSSNSNIMTNNNSPNNSSSNVISTSPNTASSHLSSNTKISYVTAQEFEQLKKMKGYCHRRLGSLYKLLSRFPEAEEHIKKYISILSRQGNNTTIRRDKANAYALLATIYELMDKREEAVLADKQALELVSLNTI